MTIKEIAALAGVSTSTVSKIMNGKDQSINPATRSRVLKVAKEHHYEPYSTVKNISTPKKFLLGLVLNSLSDSTLILDGILETAQQHGYQILLFNSDNSPEQELKHISALCTSRVDGVIWEPVNEKSTEHKHFFSKQNIPVCYLNAPDGIPSYFIDFKKAGYALTQELINQKHANITCILKKDDFRSAKILEGFQKCLYDNKIPFQEAQILYSPINNCYSSIIAHNVTGVICAHYSDALALYEQLENLNYHIPSALSLVSLSSSIERAYDFPCISCIEIPYREFGAYLCNTLIQVCEKTFSKNSPDVFIPEYVFTHKKSISTPSFLRSKKLVVVGSINTDVTFIVDRLPLAGKTTEISTSVVSVGGKGANQSVGAAKLGREVALIGKVGNDLDSSLILHTLEKEHISVRGIYRDMNAPTGKAYIYISDNGESSITILSGANRNLMPEDIKKQKHLFTNTSFCLLSTEIPVSTIIEAAKVAHSTGAKIILKPAVLQNIPDELLALTDIFVPNQNEASTLCPYKGTIEEQAKYFYEKGAKIVIITLGDKGCYLKTAENNRYFPAADFDAIDMTGGADAFICALASYLTEGYSIEKTIRIATYAAGFCVSRQGVVSALIDRNTLETYIAQHEWKLLSEK